MTNEKKTIPIARRAIHSRTITCNAYARDDGLIDIDGILVDTKPFDVFLPERGDIQSGEPIHELMLKATIDCSLMIRDIVVETSRVPYGGCGDINANYRQLIGHRIAPGFTGLVKRMFRATSGCSHLTELLSPIATTAYQALWGDPSVVQESSAAGDGGERIPGFINGCHALRRDGRVVKELFPQWYQGSDDDVVPKETR